MTEFLGLTGGGHVYNARSVKTQYRYDYQTSFAGSGSNPIARNYQTMSSDDLYARYDEILESGILDAYIEYQNEAETWYRGPISVSGLNGQILPAIIRAGNRYNSQAENMYKAVMGLAKEGIDVDDIVDYSRTHKKYGSISTVGKLNASELATETAKTTNLESGMEVLSNVLTEAEFQIILEHMDEIDLTEELPDGSPRYVLAGGSGGFHVYDMAASDPSLPWSGGGAISICQEYGAETDKIFKLAGSLAFMPENFSSMGGGATAADDAAMKRFIERSSCAPVYALSENGLRQVSSFQRYHIVPGGYETASHRAARKS